MSSQVISSNMEDHNLDIIVFSEMIRKQMQTCNPPLIKSRRKLFPLRVYTDVFVGSEAIVWATNSLTTLHDQKFQSNKNGNSSVKIYLSEQQACDLFQKLMDAGLLQNVTTQELFKNDKSFFRFASDDTGAEKLIRAVAIGFRLFDSAISSNNIVFEKVCALGRLVSTECLKASQIVTWLVNNGLSATRQEAVSFCSDMTECNVLQPVDGEIQEFTDGSSFYMFEIDYRKPMLTLDQLLRTNAAPPVQNAAKRADASHNTARNRLIHLRQTSDQLLDLSHLSLQKSSAVNRQQGLGTDYNGNTSPLSPTYQSLLNCDGSMTKAALFHPSSPYVKKDILICPDAVGYGFVIRGSGPCYVKIVDPDSPAGRAGLQARQYVTRINGNDVMEMNHSQIEDLILGGPKFLKITVMQEKNMQADSKPPVSQQPKPVRNIEKPKKSSPFPTAQPWIQNKTNTYKVRPANQVASR